LTICTFRVVKSGTYIGRELAAGSDWRLDRAARRLDGAGEVPEFPTWALPLDALVVFDSRAHTIPPMT
jgi:hypothetical protein